MQLLMTTHASAYGSLRGLRMGRLRSGVSGKRRTGTLRELSTFLPVIRNSIITGVRISEIEL